MFRWMVVSVQLAEVEYSVGRGVRVLVEEVSLYSWQWCECSLDRGVSVQLAEV